MREILMQEYVGDKSPELHCVFRCKDQQLEEFIPVYDKQGDLKIKWVKCVQRTTTNGEAVKLN